MDEPAYYEALMEMRKIENTDPFDREKWDEAYSKWLSIRESRPRRWPGAEPEKAVFSQIKGGDL